MDRREFVAGAAAGLAGATGWRAGGLAGDITHAQLPASPSARLPAQEPTFSPTVFTARIEKARAALAAAKLDLLVATPSTNYEYLTGYNPERSERLIALFLPPKGDPIIVCPAFEVERLKQHSIPADLRRRDPLGRGGEARLDGWWAGAVRAVERLATRRTGGRGAGARDGRADRRRRPRVWLHVRHHPDDLVGRRAVR